MAATFDTATMQQALDWAYDKAVSGIPNSRSDFFGRAEDLAASYLRIRGTRSQQVKKLITSHTSAAAATGFVTGLGGIITLPVAIPANIVGVLFAQIRMVAAIACMGEYDVHDHQVQTLCYICLCGNSAGEILKGVGVQASTKIAQRAIQQIPFAAIKKINQAVGFRLITKFGTTGVVNLGKALPLVGGVVGGTFDAVSTRAIGNYAHKMFIE
ncbi:EcsC family protein [Chloroflexia bacterium SDU3-3]|nr:EcsC family protein [Chloroflexia bacterium SDU3-3]